MRSQPNATAHGCHRSVLLPPPRPRGAHRGQRRRDERARRAEQDPRPRTQRTEPRPDPSRARRPPDHRAASEYSLWERSVENGVISTCRELGITLVPYNPLGRSPLTAGSSPPPDRYRTRSTPRRRRQSVRRAQASPAMPAPETRMFMGALLVSLWAGVRWERPLSRVSPPARASVTAQGDSWVVRCRAGAGRSSSRCDAGSSAGGRPGRVRLRG